MIRFSDQVVDSGVLKKYPHVIILGKVSVEVLKNVASGFGNKSPRDYFFVSYSEIDIPLEAKFTRVFCKNIENVFTINSVLTGATQQYGKPFDLIPHGWKTICKFSFSGELPRLISDLPVIDDWADYQYGLEVVMCTEPFIEELKKNSSPIV